MTQVKAWRMCWRKVEMLRRKRRTLPQPLTEHSLMMRALKRRRNALRAL
jgi:hypothetical protein